MRKAILLFLAIGSSPASTVSATEDLIHDPHVLREKLKAMETPAELQRFAMRQWMFGDPGDVTEETDPARLAKQYGKVGCDLFEVNLFGSEEKEAILQARFAQITYVLVFFERKDGKWRRIQKTLFESNPESGCKPQKCPGNFCIDFTEARRKGESIVVGRSCGVTGGFGGVVEEARYWQITPEGPHELTRVEYRLEGRNSRTGKTGLEAYEYRFQGEFPKKLQFRALSAKKQEPWSDVPLSWAPQGN